jgi:hypothetical protein
LGEEPLERALVEDLTISQARLVRAHDCPTGGRGHMQELDTVHIGQCRSMIRPLVDCDELIDIDRVNRLVALWIATTVAMRLPTSG